MKTQPFKYTNKIIAAVVLLALPMCARAGSVSLKAADAVNTSSFNSADEWNNSLAPSAANDYYTAAYFMRTPTDGGSTSYTFAGNSLTLQQPTSSTTRSIINKSGNGDTFVINNLTNAFGGILENGGNGNVSVTFTGNLWTIAANSGVTADQGPLVIGYPLAGASGVILTNTGGNASGITYNGNNSAFQGIFYLSTISFGNGGGNTTVILNAANSQPANPMTPTPNQIWISSGCTVQDNVGLTFNNANGGFLLNGPGNANINAAVTTVISEPITDLTNGVSSVCSLTKTGSGTLNLASANNTYAGNTIISAGTLQQGVANTIPAPAVGGDVTDNGTLDMNTHSATINGLNGSGTVDTVAGGTPTLTIGTNGDSGTFSGTIQNSSGTLSVTKVGVGTETLSGSYTYSGATTVAGGTLVLNTANSLPSTPGSLIVSNGGVLSVSISPGTSLPANNLVFGNGTNVFSFGTVTANPTAPAIVATGGISAPGSLVVITINATGLRPGSFTLISYTGTTLANLANFQLSPPPGVAASLVNDTTNHSIDVQITSIPNVLTWNGVNGTAWNLSTPNWTNPATGGITVFQQYTNNGVVAGDAVTFDDTLTNSSPQPTNVVLNSTFYAFPVVVDTSLPYTIAGAGGITGVTSLNISNSAAGSGSLTLLTSNNFSGGVNLTGETLIITNDSALGAPAGPVTLNDAVLQYNGSSTNNVRAFSMPVNSAIGVATNATVRIGGPVSGGGAYFDTYGPGTLILAARETLTGDLFLHSGTLIIDTGGSFTNANYDDIGHDTNDSATLTIRGTGAFATTSDFNVGDLGASVGTLNVQGTATLTVNAFYIGSADVAGNTAVGTVNQTGGTVTEVSTTVGTFCIGGRTSVSGVGTYNMGGGTLQATAGIRVGSTGTGVLNQTGGLINATTGVNIARIAGSFGTNNLNGGVLSTFNVTTSTGSNDVFNFNGGTLQANFSPPSSSVSGSAWFTPALGTPTVLTYILAGGAFIDSSNNNVTITVPLLAGSPNGGLTKLGSGTLNLTGTNTFTGPITNNAGTLSLNSASTYSGGAVVNGGTLAITPADAITGGTVIGNNGILSFAQQGSGTASLDNLTFNGAASGQGAALAVTQTSANNPAVALVNCQALTLNGTNSINLAVAQVGTLAIIKYTGTIAGSGNCTNLILPQGGIGYISNSAAASTLYAVVTSTGPGLVWTGTNTLALDTWNINATTNWLVSSIPTSYHQIISPGDAVTFNDIGNATVLLNTNVAPANMVISNNVKAYTFSGSGAISSPGGLLKLGTSTATLNLTNSSYLGNTVISNGTLQVGDAAAISPTSDLNIGSGGTLQLAGFNQTAGQLTGSGTVDNNNGHQSILTIGSSTSGTWSGTITNTGGGGVSLVQNGSGRWVVSGNNYLNDGQSFTDLNQINQGTTVITNGGLLETASLQFQIANGSGLAATVTVDGGALVARDNVLSVGYGAGATGTLMVNHGTVDHSGYSAGSFGAVANSIDVGAQGSTGTLIVNGGQVLNDLTLYLGDGAGSSGTLQLNGGLVQAGQLIANATPMTSVANFNGGTLQAATNSLDFIDATVTGNIQSGGLILDDGGWVISLPNGLQSDLTSLGGGLIKRGAGTVYLDGGNSYTGTTLVTNGFLAGSGSIEGPVVVGPAGNIGAGDAAGPTGEFSVNNTLTIQGGATMRISVTGNSPVEDQLYVSGNIIYGGVLTITNVTSDPTVLANGDTFQLFSVSGSYAGNFSSIAGSPGSGLGYSFNPTNGVLSVITQTIAPNPAPISFSVSGNTLALSWPSDHLGWILQSQTNSLSTGLSNNWTDVAGTSSVTSTNFTMSQSMPVEFFRLRHP